MAKKISFIVYTDQEVQVNLLNDAQAGRLFKAMLAFARTGEEGCFDDGMLQMLYSIIIAQMKRDAVRYEEICEKRRNAARRGGKAKAANCQQKLHDTDTDTETETDTVTDSDSDTVNDTDTVSVCDCVPESVQAAPKHTHTTPQAQVFSVQEAMRLAQSLGYHWNETEAAHFLAYNQERQRSGDWYFAVKHWEAQRKLHPTPVADTGIDTMEDYLSVVNRFREDEETPGDC